MRRPARALAGVVLAAALVAGGLAAFSSYARHRILEALGPRTTVGEISVSWPVVTLRDVHIAADPAPGAWPSADEFRAARVVARLDTASLRAHQDGTGPLRFEDVQVEDAALVMLRTQGHVTMLPALRESTRQKAQAMDGGPASGPVAVDPQASAPVPATTALVVEHLHAEHLAIDFYDATLGPGAPRHLQFEDVRGDVGDLSLPTLDTAVQVDAAGKLKGVERDGTATVRGAFTPATHDAKIALKLAGVDLIALQPWVLKLGEGAVKHGVVDLQLDAQVAHRELEAPGHLTLSGLALSDTGGTFAQAKRRAVLATLERDGRIDIDFHIQGHTDDPKFSLDDSLVARIFGGIAESATEGVKSTVQGIGGAIKGLFGGKN